MFKPIKLILLLIFLCSFYLTSSAQEKSTVIKQLSKDADVILLGKVTKKVSNWDESKTRIYFPLEILKLDIKFVNCLYLVSLEV